MQTSFMFVAISSPSAVMMSGIPHSSGNLLSEVAQSSLSKDSSRDIMK